MADNSYYGFTFDPSKGFQANYEGWVNAEKLSRKDRGLDPNGLSPEWLAGLKSEISQRMMNAQADRLLNPNSDYYKNVNKAIRSQVTGALSPESILALTVAMGGSPAQAQQQIKAKEGQINEAVGNLSNQYYLNASGQGNSLLSSIAQMTQQESQFQTNLRNQNDLYNQQKSDSLLNQGLGLIGGIAGNLLAPGIGGAIGSQLGSSIGSGFSGNFIGGSYTNPNYVSNNINSYFKKPY